MSTNAQYLKLRDWNVSPHYFPSRAFQSLREYYHQCFTSQIASDPNDWLSMQAAWASRRPFLSSTARDRYYEEFSFLRRLRRIAQGKDIYERSTHECLACQWKGSCDTERGKEDRECPECFSDEVVQIPRGRQNAVLRGTPKRIEK